jgi:hypothetical protein
MSDPVREIAGMVTNIDPGPRMIEGALLKNVYAMLGLHGRAATVEVGIRMVDEGTLRELAKLMAQAGLVEAFEETGDRLVNGTLWRALADQALKPLFTPYVASAVHLDGLTYLGNSGLNVADSPFYGFSFWFQYAAPLVGSALTFGHDVVAGVLRPAGAFTQGTPGEFFSLWRSADSLSSFELHSTTVLSPNVWHHVMGAVDTNHPLGAKIGVVYVDGVLATAPVTDVGAAFFNVLAGKDVRVGGDQAGDKQIADFADIRLAPGQNWLVNGEIPATTRALFIDADQKPVDPAIATAALGAPAILFSGHAASFATNRGYGGPFSLTGTLTNAATSPTD